MTQERIVTLYLLLATLAALPGPVQSADEHSLPAPATFVGGSRDVSDVSISPDGRYLAYRTYLEGRSVAVTMDRSRGYARKIVTGAPKDSKLQVDFCRWANESRLLCVFTGNDYIFGNPFPFTRLLAVNADGTDAKVLMNKSGPEWSRVPTQFQGSIIDVTPGDPRTILITGDSQVDGNREVLELDIYTGLTRQHYQTQEKMYGFFSDGTGEVRRARGYEFGETIEFIRTEQKWRELARYSEDTKTTALMLVGAMPAAEGIYARMPHEGRSAIWAFERADSQEPQLVFSHPTVDAGEPARLRDGKIVGFQYDTDFRFVHYMDQEAKRVMDSVRTALPLSSNRLIDRTADGQTYIIAAESDTTPETYYLLSISAKEPQLEKIGGLYADVDPKRTASMSPIRFVARDGMEIPGYLITRQGVRPEKLPLIVRLGDSSDRTVWGFDPIDQFLASRGYSILIVNHRGLSGFGVNWKGPAAPDWRGQVMSDVEDGVRWALAQGIGDPKRVCIQGSGMGGYVALLASTRQTQLFRCAMAVDSPSDLKALRDQLPWLVGKQSMVQRLGTANEDADVESPLRSAASIQIPLLLVHHRREFLLNIKHSENLAATLKRLKKPHEFVVLENFLPADDEKLLIAMEQFLNREIGR